MFCCSFYQNHWKFALVQELPGTRHDDVGAQNIIIAKKGEKGLKR
jgi:hypothetical protein